MSSSYPVMLRLKGKKVVVVGGGRVGERKVSGLIGTGACITVIGPEVTEELRRLADEGKIVWLQKVFSEEDITDAFLIFAATNNRELNLAIKNLAFEHQLVTLADDPEESDFHVPAQLQRGHLTIAVSTDGASPILAGKIRGDLEKQYDESFKSYLDFLFEARQRIVREVQDPSLKRQLLTAIVGAEFFDSQDRETDFLKLYEKLKAGT